MMDPYLSSFLTLSELFSLFAKVITSSLSVLQQQNFLIPCLIHAHTHQARYTIHGVKAVCLRSLHHPFFQVVLW